MPRKLVLPPVLIVLLLLGYIKFFHNEEKPEMRINFHASKNVRELFSIQQKLGEVEEILFDIREVDVWESLKEDERETLSELIQRENDGFRKLFLLLNKFSMEYDSKEYNWTGISLGELSPEISRLEVDAWEFVRYMLRELSIDRNTWDFELRACCWFNGTLPRHLKPGEAFIVDFSLRYYTKEELGGGRVIPVIRHFYFSTEMENPKWEFYLSCEEINRFRVKEKFKGKFNWKYKKSCSLGKPCLYMEGDLVVFRGNPYLVMPPCPIFVRFTGNSPISEGISTFLRVKVSEVFPGFPRIIRLIEHHRIVVSKDRPIWLEAFASKEELRKIRRILNDIKDSETSDKFLREEDRRLLGELLLKEEEISKKIPGLFSYLRRSKHEEIAIKASMELYSEIALLKKETLELYRRAIRTVGEKLSLSHKHRGLLQRMREAWRW